MHPNEGRGDTSISEVSTHTTEWGRRGEQHRNLRWACILISGEERWGDTPNSEGANSRGGTLTLTLTLIRGEERRYGDTNANANSRGGKRRGEERER